MVHNCICQSEYDLEVVWSCVKHLLKESDALGYVKVANRVIRTPFTRSEACETNVIQMNINSTYCTDNTQVRVST